MKKDQAERIDGPGDSEWLDPKILQEMLAAERPAENSVDEAMEKRLTARLGAALGWPGGPGGTEGPGGPGPSSRGTASNEMSDAVPQARPGPLSKSSLARAGALAATVTFLFVGARAYLAPRPAQLPVTTDVPATPSAERVVNVRELADSPLPDVAGPGVLPPARSATRLPNESPARPFPLPQATVTHGPGEVADESLAEERRLVIQARRALASGDATGASTALAEHQQKFASGQLTEERDALRVRLLRSRGENAAAEALAEDLRRRFPDSPMKRTLSNPGAP